MPIVGIGLHVFIALLCAVHALRSGQPLYWLFILFSFPLLGSIAYFLVIYLPNSRLERGARRAVSAAAKALDPQRELREARLAFEDTPTAQNQMRLASALLETGAGEEAARNYEACLQGPFATDPEIRYGAARAFVECGRYGEALGHLEAVRASKPDFRPEAITLLLARAYAGSSRHAEARQEFESAQTRFGTFESLAEYAIWTLVTGDLETYQRLQAEIERQQKKWNAHTRELNSHCLKRFNAALQLSRQGA